MGEASESEIKTSRTKTTGLRQEVILIFIWKTEIIKLSMSFTELKIISSNHISHSDAKIIVKVQFNPSGSYFILLPRPLALIFLASTSTAIPFSFSFKETPFMARLKSLMVMEVMESSLPLALFLVLPQ